MDHRNEAGSGLIAFDDVISRIAQYAHQTLHPSTEALETARYCLLDSIGCAILALQFPACTKLLGPVVPGAVLSQGVRIPGSPWQLEPIQAAFNLGTMIRWLDYNDTWLAAEWGHPSDNLGAILALADYLDRNPNNCWTPGRPWTLRDVVERAIQAYEIQGVLALQNGFNRVGLDHVLLVRVASSAVASAMLGGTPQQIAATVSQSWLDGGALRTYRHAPNTGSRKSWAAGDATRRAVQLALWTMAGERGYATALSAPKWGFQDVVLGGKPVVLERQLGCYVMENILFKVAYPAEFHAQTAAEAAVQLSPLVRHRLDEIREIKIFTQESAIRIIDKTGLLKNPADRDHCIQYIVAVALLHGTLRSEHYEDAFAADHRIDQLRSCMSVQEEPAYSREYLDPSMRSIGNRLQVVFQDGSATPAIAIAFPIGHRRRREESKPLLIQKFLDNVQARYDSQKTDSILSLWQNPELLLSTRVSEWMDLLADQPEP
ncbi:MAG: bifunctional 2-methylcitrate dehydratase/aconitate hydratase [Pirellulaceae bacterium]